MAEQQNDAAARLVEAMGKIEAIPKNARNIKSGYAARSIDDVYDSVHQVLADVGLVAVPYVINVEYFREAVQDGDRRKVVVDCRLLVEYRFTAADGSYVELRVAAEGRDWADKATSKAHSMALKTGLLQTFLIPLGVPDPDTETPTVEGDASPPTLTNPAPVDEMKVTTDAILAAVKGDTEAARIMWDAIRLDLGFQPEQHLKPEDLGLIRKEIPKYAKADAE